MRFSEFHQYKVALLWILCIFSLVSKAQDTSYEKEITYRSQLRFSLAGLVYDNLKLTHDGTEHLESSPTLSGAFTISYYNHIWNGYGLILGAGFTLASTNMHYDFQAPANSIFRTNNFFDYDALYDAYYDYDEMLFVVPLSVNKTINVNQRQYSLEIGTQLNVMNQDPDYLPARKRQGASYGISDDNPGDNSNFVRLFDSYTDVKGGIVTLSYFMKVGWVKLLKKQRTLEYKVVANWSPKKIRTGEFEFQNLGYLSQGKIEQNINYIGFEVSYGLTIQRRLKENVRTSPGK